MSDFGPNRNDRRDPLGKDRRSTVLEIGELRTATARLSEQVATLSLALQTVSTLQAKQREVERVASLAAAAADEQRELSASLLNQLHQIDDTAVTQQDMINYRKRIVARATTIAVVVVGLMSLVLLAGVNYTAGHNASVYKICMDRNRGAIALHDYLDKVLARVSHPTSAQAAQVDLLRTLEKATVISNCGSLR